MALLLHSLLLAACGGGSSGASSPPPVVAQPLYRIGGTVSGLAGGNVVLQNNGGGDLTVSADGTFAFTKTEADGTAYAVTVLNEPESPWQTCGITAGSGSVNGSDVANIAVDCATNRYRLAVTVIGLRLGTLTLQNAGGEDLTVAKDGMHEFPAPVESGSNYSVEVVDNPTDPDLSCSVTDGNGVVANTDVTSITIECAALAAVDIAAGDSVSCAILENGRTKCWGENRYGGLGLGDGVDRGRFPGEMGNDLEYVNVSGASRPVGIDPGKHSCAVLENGRVKCWGRNRDGQLGLGDTTDRGQDPKELGANLPALDLGTNQIGNSRTALLVGAGLFHSCAVLDAVLDSNEELKCWGYNDFGQLGQEDTISRGNQPGEMGNSLDAVDVGDPKLGIAGLGVGGFHTCVLQTDGAVYCWGSNSYGQLGLGDALNRGGNPGDMGAALGAVKLGSGQTAVQLVSGSYHNCALLDSGFVKCWGRNTDGQLGQGDLLPRGDQPDELGDKLPVVPLGSVNLAVTQLAAGTEHTCALIENGGVKCWGGNGFGQLGLGDTLDRGDEPGEMGFDLPFVDLGNGRTAVRISAGSTHSCALLDSGDIKCWGENDAGQLGQENVASTGDAADEMGDRLVPIDIGSN
ncbi:MAG: hypothetical protein AAGE85_12575 [Pseudomonadota bacterium]